jgi:hypothetical protein
MQGETWGSQLLIWYQIAMNVVGEEHEQKAS